MKVRCDIKGLDCPHCALELEQRIARLEGVSSASINFAMGRLVLDVDGELSGQDEDAIVGRAQEVADGFADGIQIEISD